MHSLLLIVPLLALATAKPQPGSGGLFECNGKCDLPCSKNLNCPNGIVKDKCGCCDVCLEKEDGRCGGPRNLFGVCAEGLLCKMIEKTDVGECKKVPLTLSCESITCDPYQTCVMENEMPVCTCSFDCKNVKEEDDMPFCDVDGNEYENLCEVRKKICESKREFFYLPGKCQGCLDRDGREYNHSEIVRPPTKDTPCQEDWCNHGSIVTRINKGCLNDLGFTCTIGASNTNDIVCGKDFSCHVLKWSTEPDMYPHLGKCKKAKADKCFHQGKEYDLNTKFIKEDCSGRCSCSGWNKLNCVSLCPPTTVTCRSDEIKQIVRRKVGESHCNCKVPVCMKSETVCAMKPESGPCYAYFSKWHYNPETKKCQKFIYGGCSGNGNRFNTKEECEKICSPPPKVLPILIRGEPLVVKPQADRVPRAERPFRWPVADPPKPVLSDIKMVVKGKIRFNGVKKILRTPSCLFVTFSDVSLMDAPAAVIKSERFDLSGYDTSVDYDYVLEASKPADNQLWRSYSISAIIYRNRCPETRQSINLGDFLSTTRHSIKVMKALNVYEKNIDIICYECKEGDDMLPPIVTNDENPVIRRPADDSEDADLNKSKKILLKPGCEFEGKLYKFGENFINNDCTGKCICNKNGKISCVTLCPPKEVICKDNEKKMTINQTISQDSKCQCEVDYCIRKDADDDECVFQGEKHKIGERFVSKDCRGYCTCNSQFSFGCVSLCPPMYVACGMGEIESVIKEPTMRPECTCERPTCVPDPSFKPLKMMAPVPPKVIANDEMSPFGGGVVYNVTFEEDKEVTILGTIKFPKYVRQFTGNSCLYIIISDVSIMDASSFTVLETQQDVSDKIINGTAMEFEVNSPKPIEKDLDREYSIGLALFNGRCEDKQNKLREGDFYSDSINPIMYKNDTDEFEIEVKVREYKDFIFEKKESKKEDKDSDEEEVEEVEENEGEVEEKEEVEENEGEVEEKEEAEENEGEVEENEGEVEEKEEAEENEEVKEKEGEEEKEGEQVEFEWPIGGAPDVQLETNKTIELSGRITFKRSLGKLPKGSCIKFRFEDVSLLDASSFLVGQSTQDVSDLEIIGSYPFTFRTPKPIEEDLHSSYAISATLFIGRCPQNRSFHQDDWYTDTTFYVPLRKDLDVYNNITFYLKDPRPTPQNVRDEETCMDLLTREVKRNGEKWDEGDCTHCECYEGKRICAMESCKAECEPEFMVKEPGVCCPVCVPSPPKDCYDEDSNTTYEHDSSWKKDDCTSCMCKDGKTVCAIQGCGPVMCENPVRKPGQCCPVCLKEKCYDSTSKRTYKNMETWVRPDGCTRCYCFGNKPMCASPMCYLEPCEDGFSHVTVKGICCPVCSNKKICRAEDGRAFIEGRVWQDEQCQVCRCTADGIKCIQPDIDTENCTERVVQLSKKCGKICLSKEKTEIETKEKVEKEENEKEEEDEKEVEDEELFP